MLHLERISKASRRNVEGEAGGGGFAFNVSCGCETSIKIQFKQLLFDIDAFRRHYRGIIEA